MLVTTIIPVHNRATMLREAVASVIAQTHRPIEIIVVDDGSTDDTSMTADEIAREHSEVRVIHQPNGGPGVAREAGRNAARGDFVQHLDSDDLLLPRKFELQVAGLLANPDCGASYGWTRWRHDHRVEDRPAKRSGERIETLFPAMLQSRWWDTPAPLWRASLIRDSGPWLPLRSEEDWEYDARLASRGVRLHYVADWVCEVRRHDAHLSGHGNFRDRAAAHARIYEHARRAGIGPEAPEMQHFARELFLLARQSGAAGLAEESQMLFRLAREASGERANALQFRAYEAFARVLGWPLAGKLASLSDRLR